MGEPLTHPDLPLFMALAKERGFKSIITTNGTLLKKRGEELLSAGVHKLNISVHSFEEGDDTAFERYIGELCDFAARAISEGTIIVFRLWNKGVDGGLNERVISFLKTRFGDEWRENTKGFRILDRLYLEWGDRFTWPDSNAPVQSERVFCYGMRDHFGILCDGTVVPCCLDSDGAIALGNVFSENLSDILESPRAEAIRKGFERRSPAPEELCRRCAYATRFK
jgi:radical SAM protein with 4Fe4S-binding SPASM domain